MSRENRHHGRNRRDRDHHPALLRAGLPGQLETAAASDSREPACWSTTAYPRFRVPSICPFLPIRSSRAGERLESKGGGVPGVGDRGDPCSPSFYCEASTSARRRSARLPRRSASRNPLPHGDALPAGLLRKFSRVADATNIRQVSTTDGGSALTLKP